MFKSGGVHSKLWCGDCAYPSSPRPPSLLGLHLTPNYIHHPRKIQSRVNVKPLFINVSITPYKELGLCDVELLSVNLSTCIQFALSHPVSQLRLPYRTREDRSPPLHLPRLSAAVHRQKLGLSRPDPSVGVWSMRQPEQLVQSSL